MNNDSTTFTKALDENAKRIEEDFLMSSIPKDLLFSYLDNPHESLILLDAKGIVRFLSTVNEKVYNISIKEAIGRHISEISKKNRLLRVLETGKAEIGKSTIFEGTNPIIARIPIKKNNQVIGVIGKLLFMHSSKIKELAERIDLLEKNVDYYKNKLLDCHANNSSEKIIGNSEEIIHAKALVTQVARLDSPIIILGESGTGKELFAQAIHESSKRKDGAFVKINCGSIPAELIESELFGYEPGSFTGASKKGKFGKFELANKGTILLDEIGDMPLHLQIKMMRVLQEKEIEKIGSNVTKKIDFRVIAATNRNLEEMVEKGEFRLDLFFRLNVIVINLPPLRNMKKDIPLLISHFLSELNSLSGENTKSVSEEAMRLLESHSWPGNVRELKNVIERALIVCTGTMINADHLPPNIRKISSHLPRNKTIPLLQEVVEKLEKKTISEALEITGNNKRKAAMYLGINRSGLYHKIKKYRLL